MRRFTTPLLFLTLLTLVFFGTGCGDDTPGGGNTNPLPPTISLAADAGFLSTDSNVPFGTPAFSVRVNVNDGDNALNSLTITQDGVTLPFGNLVWDNGNTQSQNPFLITGADQSGTSYDITITPENPAANGTSAFTFTVADTEGRSAAFTINITFATNPPTISLTGAIQGDTELSALSPGFTLDYDAAQGDAALMEFAVYQNGVLLPADSLSIDMNPLPLSSAPTATGAVTISPVTPVDGLTNFTLEVLDDLGVVGSVTVGITYVIPEVTELNGVLLNQAGMAGTGGLDLDTGTGTGSNDAEAEIQDEGIDLDVTAADNWRQQISAANDATLRVVNVAMLPDGFSFDSVVRLDEIVNAYNTGSDPTGSDDNCNCTDGESNEVVTDVVMVGDLYTVLRGDKYYLIRVDEVNNTDTGNGDNYVLSIKQ